MIGIYTIILFLSILSLAKYKDTQRTLYGIGAFLLSALGMVVIIIGAFLGYLLYLLIIPTIVVLAVTLLMIVLATEGRFEKVDKLQDIISRHPRNAVYSRYVVFEEQAKEYTEAPTTQHIVKEASTIWDTLGEDIEEDEDDDEPETSTAIEQVDVPAVQLDSWK
jgi:uncharacterized protein YacL